MRVHLSQRDADEMDPAPALYAIRIDGNLDPTLLSAFPAVAVRWEGPHTLLVGVLDQSALFGVLAEMAALGLSLVEVRRETLSRPVDESR